MSYLLYLPKTSYIVIISYTIPKIRHLPLDCVLRSGDWHETIFMDIIVATPDEVKQVAQHEFWERMRSSRSADEFRSLIKLQEYLLMEYEPVRKDYFREAWGKTVAEMPYFQQLEARSKAKNNEKK